MQEVFMGNSSASILGKAHNNIRSYYVVTLSLWSSYYMDLNTYKDQHMLKLILGSLYIIRRFPGFAAALALPHFFAFFFRMLLTGIDNINYSYI